MRIGSIQQRWGTPNTTDPFGYKGQYGCITDLDTGLVQMGFRQYDPSSGRWLTRDPIGYAGGLNLYQYCGNDPVNFTDVLGLETGYRPFDSFVSGIRDRVNNALSRANHWFNPAFMPMSVCHRTRISTGRTVQEHISLGRIV